VCRRLAQGATDLGLSHGGAGVQGAVPIVQPFY